MHIGIRQFNGESEYWITDFELHFMINKNEDTTYHVGDRVEKYCGNLHEKKGSIFTESFMYEGEIDDNPTVR